MENYSAEMTNQEEKQEELKKGFIPWIKRLGFAGFMFFFIKGLIWIFIFVATAIWGPEVFDGVKEFFSNLF